MVKRVKRRRRWSRYTKIYMFILYTRRQLRQARIFAVNERTHRKKRCAVTHHIETHIWADTDAAKLGWRFNTEKIHQVSFTPNWVSIYNCFIYTIYVFICVNVCKSFGAYYNPSGVQKKHILWDRTKPFFFFTEWAPCRLGDCCVHFRHERNYLFKWGSKDAIVRYIENGFCFAGSCGR